jgi:hypothetical protein
VSLTGALSVQDNNYLKKILVGDKRKLSRNKHRANSNTEKAQEEEKHKCNHQAIPEILNCVESSKLERILGNLCI